MIRNDSSNMFQDILNSEEAEKESTETKEGILPHWQKFNYSIPPYFLMQIWQNSNWNINLKIDSSRSLNMESCVAP